jgi:UDP-GlcNAc3NAcA epimerase
MKVLTILGARPQFVKAATVSRLIKTCDDIQEVIVHTGQHFDANMSQVFFDQLDIPSPNYNLNIAGLSHGAMTARMLEGIEGLIQKERPKWILVYGDTNSTLAGALAAIKLHVPVIHVEAGLRSHNSAMPEEINRVLTDRISSLLLCPTQTAVNNLRKEGFPFPLTGGLPQRITNIGDVMLDAVLYYRERAYQRVSLDSFGLQHQQYALCTLHRQENTDVPNRIENILSALRSISKELPVVLPLHPRTKSKIERQHDSNVLEGITVLDPLPYLEMQRLQMSAKAIFTDSGGMQKEAYFHRVPCLTLRDETEWIETVEAGWNQLVGADTDKFLRAWQTITAPDVAISNPFGDGHAANNVLAALRS